MKNKPTETRFRSVKHVTVLNSWNTSLSTDVFQGSPLGNILHLLMLRQHGWELGSQPFCLVYGLDWLAFAKDWYMSPQSNKDDIIGRMVLPSSLNAYSTRTGTSG